MSGVTQESGRTLDGALLGFGIVVVLAFPLLVSWGRGLSFTVDDYDFLATRTGGSAFDLFKTHNAHWVTLPAATYRLLWWLVGVRSYLPYQLLLIGLHLVAAALLLVVMRPAGVSPWIATIAATVFVLLGAGAENIVIAFQITFVGSLVFGLAHLLLDRQRPQVCEAGRQRMPIGYVPVRDVEADCADRADLDSEGQAGDGCISEMHDEQHRECGKEQRGNEETAEHKEQIDAEKAAGHDSLVLPRREGENGVRGHDEDDREPSYPVERRGGDRVTVLLACR